jgi:4-hydroxy-tetrahydrodipicolinate synthase
MTTVPEPLFRGVGVALVTLFDERLDVDLGATAEHAARLVDLGVTAVLVAGTTGEASSLDPEERRGLIAAVTAAVPPAVPVLAGTGAPSARQAARLTADAAEAGADAALVLSPPGAADARPYFEAVAAAAGDLPLLAYHYPAVSAPGIPVEHLADLPVVGCKDSSGDLERLLREVREWDRPVYPGSSALVASAATLGCPGVILALANAEPEGCVAAFTTATTDGPQAQLDLLPAHLGQRVGGFPHGIKRLTAERFGTPTAARLG